MDHSSHSPEPFVHLKSASLILQDQWITCYRETLFEEINRIVPLRFQESEEHVLMFSLNSPYSSLKAQQRAKVMDLYFDFFESLSIEPSQGIHNTREWLKSFLRSWVVGVIESGTTENHLPMQQFISVACSLPILLPLIVEILSEISVLLDDSVRIRLLSIFTDQLKTP